MNSRILKLILAGISIIPCGCARDVANRYYSADRFPPKNAKDVELLFRAPVRHYVVIADLQSRGESPAAMKKRAAKIGADAVIVTPVGGFHAISDEWADNDSMSGTYSRLIGSAIKYTQ